MPLGRVGFLTNRVWVEGVAGQDGSVYGFFGEGMGVDFADRGMCGLSFCVCLVNVGCTDLRDFCVVSAGGD